MFCDIFQVNVPLMVDIAFSTVDSFITSNIVFVFWDDFIFSSPSYFFQLPYPFILFPTPLFICFHRIPVICTMRQNRICLKVTGFLIIISEYFLCHTNVNIPWLWSLHRLCRVVSVYILVLSEFEYIRVCTYYV